MNVIVEFPENFIFSEKYCHPIEKDGVPLKDKDGYKIRACDKCPFFSCEEDYEPKCNLLGFAACNRSQTVPFCPIFGKETYTFKVKL